MQENIAGLIENGTFPKQLPVASKDAKHEVVIMYIYKVKERQVAYIFFQLEESDILSSLHQAKL